MGLPDRYPDEGWKQRATRNNVLKITESHTLPGEDDPILRRLSPNHCKGRASFSRRCSSCGRRPALVTFRHSHIFRVQRNSIHRLSMRKLVNYVFGYDVERPASCPGFAARSRVPKEVSGRNCSQGAVGRQVAADCHLSGGNVHEQESTNRLQSWRLCLRCSCTTHRSSFSKSIGLFILGRERAVFTGFVLAHSLAVSDQERGAFSPYSHL